MGRVQCRVSQSGGIRATWGGKSRWEKPDWKSTFNKFPDDSTGHKGLINTRLGQCFSSFNIHMTHLQILLKCRFEFSGPERGRVRAGWDIACLTSSQGKSMLLVYGAHLSGRGLEDLSPLEQISFALFLDHRLNLPASESIPESPSS